jgi:DNA-binding transcriptional MerR regulator
LSPLNFHFISEATVSGYYPKAFIEQALVKVFSRGERSVNSVAEELNVNHHTLKYWMKKKIKVVSGVQDTSKERRPQDWTADEQLAALQETHGLDADAVQAWCRERGIFPHHLASWKAAFCAAPKESAEGGRELRELKEEIAALKREAVRKDKALAEAAALLMLQKKYRALWEDEDK